MHNENFLKILKTKPETLKKTINQTIEILENNNCKFKSFFKWKSKLQEPQQV